MRKQFCMICSLFFGILVIGCSLPDKDKELIAKWSMVKVLEKSNDITSQLNPENDRWIKFHEDNTFESDGTPFNRNTGSYILDKEKSTLSLISDAGEGDNSQWHISISADSMVWKGIGSERQESTAIHYAKAKE